MPGIAAGCLRYTKPEKTCIHLQLGLQESRARLKHTPLGLQRDTSTCFPSYQDREKLLKKKKKEEDNLVLEGKLNNVLTVTKQIKHVKIILGFILESMVLIFYTACTC